MEAKCEWPGGWARFKKRNRFARDGYLVRPELMLIAGHKIEDGSAGVVAAMRRQVFVWIGIPLVDRATSDGQVPDPCSARSTSEVYSRTVVSGGRPKVAVLSSRSLAWRSFCRSDVWNWPGRAKAEFT